MPITISGSGTITGISAGGLPDASVTADEIASGAVLPAKLSTGAPSWDSSGVFSFNSGYGSVATAYGCRAWVNFNGTGTVAIRAAGNVTSITDQGVGSYRVNFTTALVDNTYATVGTSTLNRRVQLGSATLSGSQATTNVDIVVTDAGTTVQDVEVVNVAIFR